MIISRTLKHWKTKPVILEVVLNFYKTDLASLSEETFNVLEQLLEPFLDNFFPLLCFINFFCVAFFFAVLEKPGGPNQQTQPPCSDQHACGFEELQLQL